MPILTSSSPSLADLINQVLPQTQCTKCGYQGCRPYAEAIAGGEAINRCPPGGPQTVTLLSGLTGRPAQALNPDIGEHTPLKLAVIREDDCIGCTKCIQACPVDAIVGAAKRMHTVIASECTGCDLCVEPCPVDCIDMITIGSDIAPPSREQANHWQMRYEYRESRLQREAKEQQQRRLIKLESKLGALDRGESIQKASTATAQSPEQMRSYIEAAVARTQARKAALRASDSSAGSNAHAAPQADSGGNGNEQG